MTLLDHNNTLGTGHSTDTGWGPAGFGHNIAPRNCQVNSTDLHHNFLSHTAAGKTPGWDYTPGTYQALPWRLPEHNIKLL